jgi:hypothetical protein
LRLSSAMSGGVLDIIIHEFHCCFFIIDYVTFLHQIINDTIFRAFLASEKELLFVRLEVVKLRKNIFNIKYLVNWKFRVQC